MKRPASLNRGFTLIELLIVVVILSTLAAIVVPQFSSSGDSANAAVAKSNLNAIRSAIELYRTDKGHYPIEQTLTSCDGDGKVTIDSATTNAAKSANLFAALSNYSNADGQLCKTKSASHPHGPYLRVREFPENPASSLSDTQKRSISFSDAATLGLTADDTPAAGWRYQPATGEFIINMSEYQDE